MTLREYLEQREGELLHEIEVLYDRLVPKQAELAEIRRAKEAIGVKIEPDMPVTTVGGHGGVGNIRIGLGTIGENRPKGSSPYEAMTMKQLILRVLKEQFPSGATMRQMLDHIRDAWGRDIDRGSFSPQLSRLYQEDVVGRIRSTRGWFLTEPETHIQGQRPYLLQGRITWMEPAQTTNQHEPLVTRIFEADIARDRMPYNRSGKLLWLLPREADPGDAPALRHEFPPPDDDVTPVKAGTY
jgi:hypothetical protein